MKNEIVTNNIKVRDESLEILKKNFAYCFDKNGNFDFEKFKQEISKSESLDFSKESYSMDWLGKSYARLLANDETTTLLMEDEEWNNKKENKNSENILIKGDNLEVLKHLSNVYQEKIKVIYIDPPYNTGKDGFIYQDDRKFTVEELSKLAGIDIEKAKKILEFTSSKSNSHSAWLTFMYPRLYIAYYLLKEDGVIFISIDDNELAHLKIIMDEIFGEENLIGLIPRITSFQRSGQEDYMNISHDYILCYSKNKKYNFKNIIERDLSDEVLEDKNGRYIKGDTKAILAALSQGYSKGGDYDFKYNGKIYKPETSNGIRNRWLWNIERMKAAANLGILVETKNTLRMQVYIDKKFEEGTNKLVQKDLDLIFHTADFMKEKI